MESANLLRFERAETEAEMVRCVVLALVAGYRLLLRVSARCPPSPQTGTGPDKPRPHLVSVWAPEQSRCAWLAPPVHLGSARLPAASRLSPLPIPSSSEDKWTLGLEVAGVRAGVEGVVVSRSGGGALVARYPSRLQGSPQGSPQGHRGPQGPRGAPSNPLANSAKKP
ncbi:hypothetical protein G7Z17_g3492 [Cylindrodendrum hubeiense]|uniref:Uncharacterized protein n=1 Tax=Cylindrodendrum hubeiense TaxID=595255 RepID=A0A9P5HCD9_9HYPO|nr:hypothetical protein G7Z17_g3492 [Cylindrodendrum hubeiense]